MIHNLLCKYKCMKVIQHHSVPLYAKQYWWRHLPPNSQTKNAIPVSVAVGEFFSYLYIYIYLSIYLLIYRQIFACYLQINDTQRQSCGGYIVYFSITLHMHLAGPKLPYRKDNKQQKVQRRTRTWQQQEDKDKDKSIKKKYIYKINAR